MFILVLHTLHTIVYILRSFSEEEKSDKNPVKTYLQFGWANESPAHVLPQKHGPSTISPPQPGPAQISFPFERQKEDKEAPPGSECSPHPRSERPWPSPPSSAPASSRCPLGYPPPRRRHSSPLRPTPVYRASRQLHAPHGTGDGAGRAARRRRSPRRRSTSPRTTSGSP